MASLKEMKKVKDKVFYLLEHYPHLRDNDEALTANIWYNEMEDINISAGNFLKLFSLSKFTSYGSITRVRRKIQEHNPHLRGKKFIARRTEEVKVRQGIVQGDIFVCPECQELNCECNE